MEAQDLERAVRTMGEVLDPLVALDWSVPAGVLDWTCRETLAHIGHDLLAYAAQLAGGVQGGFLPLDLVIHDDASVAEVLAVVEACGGLLAAALRAAGPDARAWHFGPCDVSGFAALGVAEVVLHTYDITQGLNVNWWIPAKFSTRVLARLAPDAAAQQRQQTGRRQHSTQVLLRHTGRLGDVGQWRWRITPDEPWVASPDDPARHPTDWSPRYTPSSTVIAVVRDGPYTCPCCGHATLPERGNFDICEECGWEDGQAAPARPVEGISPAGVSHRRDAVRCGGRRRSPGPPTAEAEPEMAHYLLSVHGPAERNEFGNYGSRHEMEEAFAATGVFNDKLHAAGYWVFAGGLAPASAATVVDGQGETPVVSDGPYLKATEAIGGFWIIDVPNLDVALQLAAEGSRACRGKVEVRPFEGLA